MMNFDGVVLVERVNDEIESRCRSIKVCATHSTVSVGWLLSN